MDDTIARLQRVYDELAPRAVVMPEPVWSFPPPPRKPPSPPPVPRPPYLQRLPPGKPPAPPRKKPSQRTKQPTEKPAPPPRPPSPPPRRLAPRLAQLDALRRRITARSAPKHLEPDELEAMLSAPESITRAHFYFWAHQLDPSSDEDCVWRITRDLATLRAHGWTRADFFAAVKKASPPPG
jgi:hypothetical protein